MTKFYEHEPAAFSEECRPSCKGCAAKRAEEQEEELIRNAEERADTYFSGYAEE